jgi:UDP-N-acetylglucosamine 2-epimerase
LVVGTSTERIVEAVNALIDDRSRYDAMANAANPYGDGLASDRIVDVIRGLGKQA